MDTVRGQNSPSGAAFDQWLAKGTVPESYVRSVLGEPLRSVSPCGWNDQIKEVVVVRGEVLGAKPKRVRKPAKVRKSAASRRSARRK